MIFLFLLLSMSLVVFSSESGINSTENRQQLFEVPEIDHIDFAIFRLEREFLSNSSSMSVTAWLLYKDLVEGKESKYIDDIGARSRLIQDGICIERNNVLQLKEFYISDELPKLSRTKSSGNLKR